MIVNDSVESETALPVIVKKIGIVTEIDSKTNVHNQAW